MKKSLFILLAIIAFVRFSSAAQIVTTSPSPLQESSQNVVLTYHADSSLGNNGLKGVSSTTSLYAHIGVITDKSTSSSDWRYTVTSWPTSATDTKANTDKNKLTYVSSNTWSLTIGDMRTYFGITDASEHIQKIALVFRNANGSKEGKTASGGDIFVDVLEEGFNLDFSSNATSDIITKSTSIDFTANTTASATISISVNGSSIGSVSNATTLTKSYTFNAAGTYDVVATANNGSETKTSTITISYLGASQSQTYNGTLTPGATKNADGTVTFCLPAPNKETVTLVGSWDNYKILNKNIMNRQSVDGYNYFWITVSGLDATTAYPYYYLISESDGSFRKVGDPYAHLVLDPYSDSYLSATVYADRPQYPYDTLSDVLLAVYKGDLDDYNWKVKNFSTPDAKNLIIYELLLRDFTGTEGAANANGTLALAKEKISYLKALGVNAVELMPIMEFNGNNSWGYNTNFYMAPDKAYGSPSEYKEFIDLCHENGMAVILDIVFNQSDGLHPWYQMYNVGNNPFYNSSAPHSYSVLNDWKQENPLVKKQWADAITYWMTAYKVDGFRFDLVKGLGDSSSYSGISTDDYNSSRVANMKYLHSVITSINPNGIHINENLAGEKEEKEMSADGQLNWSNANNAACQYAMGWDSSSNLNIFLSTNASRQNCSNVSYAESHDEERVAYKQNTYGATGIKGDVQNSMKRLSSMAAQLILAPGPKMIWQFSELGADQTTKNSSGNDTSAKKVIWSYYDNQYRKALYDNYAELIAIRTANPELFTDDANITYTGFANNVTSTRVMRIANSEKEILVLINPSISAQNSVSATANLITASNYKLLSHTEGFTPTPSFSGSQVTMTIPANSYAVIASTLVSGVDNINSSDNNINVYGGVGEITITGEYKSAKVFSVLGQQYDTLKVPAGLYIVNVDGHSVKVLVK